jgi:hypothetical protein
MRIIKASLDRLRQPITIITASRATEQSLDCRSALPLSTATILQAKSGYRHGGYFAEYNRVRTEALIELTDETLRENR